MSFDSAAASSSPSLPPDSLAGNQPRTGEDTVDLLNGEESAMRTDVEHTSTSSLLDTTLGVKDPGLTNNQALKSGSVAMRTHTAQPSSNVATAPTSASSEDQLSLHANDTRPPSHPDTMAQLAERSRKPDSLAESSSCVGSHLNGNGPKPDIAQGPLPTSPTPTDGKASASNTIDAASDWTAESGLALARELMAARVRRVLSSSYGEDTINIAGKDGKNINTQDPPAQPASGSDNADLRLRFASLQAKLASLDGESASLHAKCASLLDKFAPLQAESTSIQTKSAVVVAKEAKAVSLSTYVRAELTSLRLENATLRAELVSGRASNASFEAWLASYEADTASLIARLAANRLHKTSLEATIAFLQLESATMEEVEGQGEVTAGAAAAQGQATSDGPSA